MNSAQLISITPDAEKTMAYIARVSNPNNQENDNYAGLLKYCIKHNHWSVFEQSSMTLELETTRAIAAQVLRHRSFTYQEFSQRYASTQLLSQQIPLPELRRQDTKNRQNSIDDLDPLISSKLLFKIQEHFREAQLLYEELLSEEVAKECARMIMPLSTPTKIYMTGSCRSWIHYIELRCSNGTQKNIWILQSPANKSLLNNSLQYLKHLNGYENFNTRRLSKSR